MLDELIDAAQRARYAGARGRYAPSPTGPLHLGNVRTALLAWLQARLAGGRFVMRMEDLDEPRAVEGSAAQILEELRWLGLDWDEGPDVGGPFGPYTQSERKAIYEAALARLTEAGLIFECYCSRKDIREAVSAPHSGHPVYPGTCRDLTAEERAEVSAAKGGRRPAWRMRAPARTYAIEDVVAGAFSQQLAEQVGDFVVKRRDGLFAYQLAVVVDDALMGITDVLRGEDLLASTPRQVAIYEALGVAPPRFWHVPLMRDEAGERMSKRDGSESLQARREAGATPAELTGALAASLGLVAPGRALTPRELLGELDEASFIAALRAAR